MIFREYYVFIYQDKDSMDLWSYNVDGKILQSLHLCVTWSIRMEVSYPQCHHSYRPPYAIHLARRIQVILRWETQKKLSLVQSVIFLPISHKTRSSFPPSNLPYIIFILLLSFFKLNPFSKGKKKELPLNCLRQIRTKRNQKSRKKKRNTRT